MDTASIVIHRGDIYWIQLEAAPELEPRIPHPHVVIQAIDSNHNPLNSVIVCALTSNLKRINMPGNVLLDAGEGNLSKQSVVEVSKISTVDKTQLGEYIGSLSEQRVQQILDGIRFVEVSFLTRE